LRFPQLRRLRLAVGLVSSAWDIPPQLMRRVIRGSPLLESVSARCDLVPEDICTLLGDRLMELELLPQPCSSGEHVNHRYLSRLKKDCLARKLSISLSSVSYSRKKDTHYIPSVKELFLDLDESARPVSASPGSVSRLAHQLPNVGRLHITLCEPRPSKRASMVTTTVMAVAEAGVEGDDGVGAGQTMDLTHEDGVLCFPLLEHLSITSYSMHNIGLQHREITSAATAEEKRKREQEPLDSSFTRLTRLLRRLVEFPNSLPKLSVLHICVWRPQALLTLSQQSQQSQQSYCPEPIRDALERVRAARPNVKLDISVEAEPCRPRCPPLIHWYVENCWGTPQLATELTHKRIRELIEITGPIC
jgi:hypothetical protein